MAGLLRLLGYRKDDDAAPLQRAAIPTLLATHLGVWPLAFAGDDGPDPFGSSEGVILGWRPVLPKAQE